MDSKGFLFQCPENLEDWYTSGSGFKKHVVIEGKKEVLCMSSIKGIASLMPIRFRWDRPFASNGRLLPHPITWELPESDDAEEALKTPAKKPRRE